MIDGVPSPQTGIEVLRLPPIEYNIGDKIYKYILSDIHLGASSVHEPFIPHKIDKAMKRSDGKMGIWIIGDLYDGIFPKDPRYAPDVNREELDMIDMCDVTIDYAYKVFKPYWKNVEMMSWGNHERTVLAHNNTDMIKRTIQHVQYETGHKILHGYDMGYMVQPFKYAKGNTRTIHSTFYSHGASGGAPVTKGIIEFARILEHVTDAHAIVLGHNHMVTAHPVPRSMLNRNTDKVEMIEVWNLRTGSFKVLRRGSWEAKRQFKITPIGGALIEIEFVGEGKFETTVIL